MNSPLLFIFTALALITAALVWFCLRKLRARRSAAQVSTETVRQQGPLDGERGLAEWFESVDRRLSGSSRDQILERRAKFCRIYPLHGLIARFPELCFEAVGIARLHCPHCLDEGVKHSLKVILRKGTFCCLRCEIEGESAEFITLVSLQIPRVRSALNRTYAIGLLIDEPHRLSEAAYQLFAYAGHGLNGEDLGGGVPNQPVGPWRPSLPGVPELHAACDLPR